MVDYGSSGQQHFYTDKNYPEHFFESAPTLKDMIVKT